MDFASFGTTMAGIVVSVVLLLMIGLLGLMGYNYWDHGTASLADEGSSEPNPKLAKRIWSIAVGLLAMLMVFYSLWPVAILLGVGLLGFYLYEYWVSRKELAES